MNKYFNVLLLGGLFIFANPNTVLSAQKSELVYNDILIFMIKDKVFSLGDLKQTQKALNDFQCMYPESFITEYFDLITNKFDSKIFDKETIEKSSKTQKFKVYLSELLKFQKMSVYSQEQSVAIANELKKAIILSAKTKNCNRRFLEKDKLAPSLISVLGVEVFFRSRNISNNTSNNKDESAKARKKAISSLDSLANSIINQINHTQFEVSYEKN